jgi:hypothetical protein
MRTLLLAVFPKEVINRLDEHARLVNKRHVPAIREDNQLGPRDRTLENIALSVGSQINDHRPTSVSDNVEFGPPLRRILVRIYVPLVSVALHKDAA